MRKSPVVCICLVLALVSGGAAAAATVHGKPLISAPAALINQARGRCVLYACASDPLPHTNWENTVAQLPLSYCLLYACLPMDLVPDHGFDDNLFPLNPDWGYQLTNHRPPDPIALCADFEHGPFWLGSPPCSTEATNLDHAGRFTLASFVCPHGRHPIHASFHGHINWEPATYEGTLTWDTHSTPGTDDDYSLDLATLYGAGATVNNAGANSIHLEFDSDETIDAFNDDNAWWKGLHEAVHVDDESRLYHAASKYLNGDFAIVTGLIGLDTVHSPAAESHPVYVIAIQTQRQVALNGGNDRWALFVRNWGDEGFCSQHDHPIPSGPLTIRIPWLTRRPHTNEVTQSASQVKLEDYDLHEQNLPSNSAATMAVLPGQGVLLTFPFPKGSSQPMYWGTVDLRWTFPRVVNQQADGVPGDQVAIGAGVGADEDGEKGDVEPLAAQLWDRIPPGARTKLTASLPHLPVNSSAIQPAGLNQTKPPVVPPRLPGLFIAASTDRESTALGGAEIRDLCSAYQDNLPAVKSDLGAFRVPCPSWAR